MPRSRRRIGAFPQAATAHDSFWDFASLMPESTHMLMWAMSDRAIPRSFRMMEGFGVHTYRFVNEEGKSTFVKFHWRPKLGMQSVVWDEALKISGADPDFHRRDLWSAIEEGNFPEWELGLQLFDQKFADSFDFDVLDATKIIPEEILPLRIVGRLVLDRNVENFFAETEQVAFCVRNVVPGIDFTNDPLLQGRIFSYQDTQLSRLLVNSLKAAVKKQKADFAVVAPKVSGASGIEADFQLAGGSSVLFDAVFVAISDEGAKTLLKEAAAVAWVHDAFAHCKVIGATKAAEPLLKAAGVVADSGVLSGGVPDAFVKTAANGRVWDREPKVRTIY
jgi:hypothetical protein